MNENESNAVLYPFPPNTLEWAESFIFTHPIGFLDTVSILSSRSQMKTPLFHFITPFTKLVWFGVFASLIAVTCVHLCATVKQCDVYLKLLMQ